MTTIDTRPDAGATGIGDPAGTAGALSALLTWATTTDHKKIGRMYAAASLLALAVIAVVGAILGFERSGVRLVRWGSLLQLFQLHTVGLLYAVLLPLVVGLAVAAVPLQVGARSIAFARLALVGFYVWLGGLGLTAAALIKNGGLGGGDIQATHQLLVGLGLLIVGPLASGLSVATSALTSRAPGMTMRRIPTFSWASLVGVLGLLISLPALLGVLIYLFVDFRIAQGTENFGGAPGAVAWLAVGFSVPMAIVIALPVLGLVGDVVPAATRARNPMRGATMAGIGLVGVAALTVVAMRYVPAFSFDTSPETFFRDVIPFLLFAGLPLLGVVVVLGTLAMTMRAARPRVRAPFVFALLGFLLVGGGVTANFVGGFADLDLFGTAFHDGAVTLTVYGAVVAAIGGFVYWAPKLTGGVVADARLIPIGLLAAAGAVLAGGAMIVAGFFDLPGGIPTDMAQVAALIDSPKAVTMGTAWPLIAAIGHLLVALAGVAALGLVIGAPAGAADDDNPYGGQTVEWMGPSPAPEHNFEYVMTVASATPAFDMTAEGGQP